MRGRGSHRRIAYILYVSQDEMAILRCYQEPLEHFHIRGTSNERPFGTGAHYVHGLNQQSVQGPGNIPKSYVVLWNESLSPVKRIISPLIVFIFNFLFVPIIMVSGD